MVKNRLGLTMQSLLDQLTKIYQPTDLFINGIEKENLRMDLASGQPSMQPHPSTLGDKLTHPTITTDFSENLIEMVTSPVPSDELITQLKHLNAFVYQTLEHQTLWPLSMPGFIQDLTHLPIADYGTTNNAMKKHIYRRGLVHRYGKAMQLIAGIHFNISLKTSFFQALQQVLNDTNSLSTFISDRYMHATRHFYRYYPILAYLFGASPSCSTQACPHDTYPDFLTLQNDHTLIGPYATTLRMSDLGYQSPNQNGIPIDLTNVDRYASSLKQATEQIYPPYQSIPIKDAQGNYQQLNCHWLQIENEYYSPIRPKQPTTSGQRPVDALKHHGIAYLEIRALDLNPFEPLGISKTQIDFVNLFTLWCLLQPDCQHESATVYRHNFQHIATYGRHPEAAITLNQCIEPFHPWLQQVLQSMQPLAQWLDQPLKTPVYQKALNQQIHKAFGSQPTPSEQVLKALQSQSHDEFGQHWAQKHQHFFATTTIPSKQWHEFKTMVAQSHQDKKALQAIKEVSFETFLANYFNPTQKAD